jgi:intracellular multiplication protein IcmE
VDGQAFAFEMKFSANNQVLASVQAARDVVLAAADEITRQYCMRAIKAASAGTISASPLKDIASAAALTRDLLDMKSLPAIKAVLAALGVAMSDACLKAVHFDSPSLKATGYDIAAFKAAGCSWADIRTAGFTAAEAKAAGCNAASAKAAGYDLPSLKAAGFDAASLKAAGCSLRELKGARFDIAALRAAGCSWADIKTAGFTAAEAKAAGTDIASAKAAGYDVPSLIAGFGYDAAAASGCDVSFILVSFSAARLHDRAHIRS